MATTLRVQAIAWRAGFFLRDVDEGGVRVSGDLLLEIGPEATDEAILAVAHRSGRLPRKTRPKGRR